MGRMDRRHLRLAKLLLIATVLYNVGEGVIAIWSGVVAGSLALIAFGGDSYLEVTAASAVLWRISTADEELGERREQRAMRIIGWTFLALAAAILYQAFADIAEREGADELRQRPPDQDGPHDGGAFDQQLPRGGSNNRVRDMAGAGSDFTSRNLHQKYGFHADAASGPGVPSRRHPREGKGSELL